MHEAARDVGSIRMHPITDLDIPYFPNRSPDAKGKAIAQKCDNCTNYVDKACIQACPTGALFQIDGQSCSIIGVSSPQKNRRRYAPSPIEQPHGWRQFWLLMTVLVSLILTWECFGRLWPELTFRDFLSFRLPRRGVDRQVPAQAIPSVMLLLHRCRYGDRHSVYRWRGRLASTPVLMGAYLARWMGAIVALHTALFSATRLVGDVRHDDAGRRHGFGWPLCRSSCREIGSVINCISMRSACALKR